MKKLTAILLSVLLLLTTFGGCSDTDDIYIGEGKMTVIRSLISANEYIANEVFGENRLEVDISATVSRNSRTYAPVISEKLTSYTAFESLLYSTYTVPIVEKLLEEHDEYIDIDGKLYLDTQYAVAKESSYSLHSFEAKLKKINDDGSYTFKVKFIIPDRFDKTVKINVTETDGVLRLCDFYN